MEVGFKFPVATAKYMPRSLSKLPQLLGNKKLHPHINFLSLNTMQNTHSQ